MKAAVVKPELSARGSTLLLLLCVLLASPAALAGNFVLQGKNKGDTNNWYPGNLQNWLELDYIPCRLQLTSDQGNNQTFTIFFEHTNNGFPGVQNLFNFSTSSNVVFTSAPVLTAPPYSGTWSYTFTVNVLDGQPAYVFFYARLAAGAHLNTGSSLALSGSPSSMGNLQIHKPGPAVGSPDLMVLKSGPVTAVPGDIITYIINFTNRPTAPNYATGVQLSDILPAEVSILTNTIGAGVLVGDTIYWDLPNLIPGDGGQIMFQAQVLPSTPFNHSFTNTSQIYSAQNDLNYADNTAIWVTTTVGCAPPSVLIAPASATRCPGDSLTFVGIANGTGPLSYQWLKNASPIGGATVSSYTISPITSADAGAYSVIVTNRCGSVSSSSGILAVNTNVSVTPLANLAICPGDSASFSTTASGTGPFTYSWSKDGVALPQTNSSLIIPSVSAADAGTYTVLVNGACGSSASSSSTLAVNSPVVVAAPPASQTVCAGANVSFTVNATGTGLVYQWYQNSNLLVGQIAPTLVLNNVSATNAAAYSVVVSGTCGNPITNNASLTVNSPAAIVTPPASQTVCPGANVSFSVYATGAGLTYRWSKNNGLLLGQTAASFALTNVNAGDAATYTVVVTGTCGVALTNSASLTVNSQVVVASPPVNQSACPGTEATFTVGATGTSLSYQWFKDTNVLSGQTAASLTLTNISPPDAGTYSVVVSGACGNSLTNSATLIVNSPVLLASPPANRTVCQGANVSFNVSASGTGLAFQWYKNNTLLAGQTASSLLLTNVTSDDEATYAVVVSGVCGTIAPLNAALVVNEPPAIVSPLSNQTNCAGATAVFTVRATGTSLSFQWYRGNTPLSGQNITPLSVQTESSLTLTNLSPTDAGIYSVVITGVCGGALTNTALLVVNSPVQIVTPIADQAACPGANVSLSVNATGTGLTYQWYKNNSLLSGQTAPTLGLTNVGSSDAANYSVVVSGMCGNPVTNSAILAVNSPIVVATPPTNQTVCPRANVSFNVGATGTGLTYQWYKDSSILAGQTSGSLLLTNVSPSDAAAYSVLVSGTCGSPALYFANLVVDSLVVVVTPPASQTVCPGANVNFSVSATGTGLTYQWYKNNGLLSGQTAPGLSLTNVSSSDAATYSVVVSGTCGNAVTNSASLTVNSQVVVVTPPANQTVCPGANVSFSVNATGTGVTYQWYKNNGLLSGQTTATVGLTNVSAGDAATYSVVVNGTCGNPATNSASLTVNSQVVVVTPPVNQTVCPGADVSFGVNATGTGLAYQWYKNNGVLSGQTAASLGLTNVSSSDAASYSVVVSGTCGNTVTNSASLTVNSQVVVVTPPANQTVCPGANVSFSVTATGTGLAYQWYKNNGLLSGQTAASLSLTNVSSGDAATYSVVVSGTCGNAVTNSASLTVNSQVVVVTPPTSQTVCPGANVSFSVTATGTGLTYQWYKNNGLLSGQTTASFSLTNVSSTDAAAYGVVVSGTCGNAVTNSASLTVNSQVVVETPPANQTVCPGANVNFSVNATGTGLTYQWYKNNSLLSGQTTASLSLPNVSSSDGATYSVVVSGTCGNAVTNSASLTLNSQVVVVTPPANQTVCPGANVSFSVNATGTGLAYQWYKNNGPLSGQTAANLTLTNVSSGDAATYSVVVSGTCGNAITNSASLTVNSQVVVVTPPASQTVCPGANVSFSVNATGTSLAYQWYKNNGLLSGQTAATLSLTNVSSTDAAAYSVVVNGTCGNAMTNTASLTVNSQAVVVTPPANQTVCPGANVSFNVNATGTGLAYQWYKNNSLLSGQTTASLSLTNVSSTDAATYSVAVSGTCGNAVTNSASLTVNSQVVVVTPPANQTVCPGAKVNFSVNATGTSLTYQWYKNNGLLSGQTSASLSLTNVSSGDAATYSVVVSGTCGNPVTNSASLTLNSQVVVVTPPNSQAVCPGANVSFSVNAAGTGLGYQWYKNNSLLFGQTAANLFLTNVSSGDAALYNVVVTGVCGGPVTNGANLIVNSPLVVVTPPASQTVCPGANINFSVSATGTGLTYQWYKDSSLLASQTSATLSLTNVTASDAAAYSVLISGACGSPALYFASLGVNSQVAIVTPPASQTACPGGSATFNVNASGSGLSYQWYKANGLLSGQTGSTLALTNVTTGDAATYSVVVAGTCGSPVTNSAGLTVNSQVAVLTPPADQTVCPSANVSFSVNASGSGLAYQWYKENSLLSGQTSSTLALTNVTSSDAAIYSVVVSGTCGSAVTNSAGLAVNSPVALVTPPASQTVCPGVNVSFRVSAIGTGLAYQWYKNNGLLSGQTAASLALTNVSSGDAASYSVVVSGTCGGPLTNGATLAVNSPVVVAAPPANQTVCPDANVNFSVSATGTGLTYQWYKNSSLLAGQTTASLSLTNVTASDTAAYSVLVSGACSSPVLYFAGLGVNSQVAVVTPPANQTACPGASVSFNVSATGTGLSYQWYKNNAPLVGQTAASLTLTNVSAGDAATYSIVLGGTCGNTVTNSAGLAVNSQVVMGTPPASQTVCPGANVGFSVSATGTRLSYQWYKNNAALSGQTAANLVLTNVSSVDAGVYSIVVSGACGPPVNSSANLAVNQNVVVVTPPSSLTLCVGASATFNVGATGTGLSYQWYRGSSPITPQDITPLDGQHGSSLTLSNVTTGDAGIYTVIVSSACGSPITNSATLSVNSPALVSTPPADQAVCPGGAAGFTVTASGTGLGYHWYKNGTLLIGQTTASLSLTNVSAGDAGVYSVTVAGICGSPITNSATLALNQPLVINSAPGNLTNCPGTSASFGVAATGTGLTYQWFKNNSPIAGQTASTLSLNNVSAADAAIYSVVVNGTCGGMTNSASLSVNAAATASPLAGATKNLGDHITFSTVAGGTGPFSYLWTKNGVTIAGASTSSLTLNNLGYSDAAVYSVQVTAACSTATQSATLVVNHPPTVTIISPTNGAVFIAPANFTVLADAEDIDGTVTNVDFFVAGTNHIGQSATAPYFVPITNAAPGTYTFTATATDNLGATGNSAPVTVTVLQQAPLTITSAMRLNLQTGLYEETVRVSNPTYSTFDSVRVYVGNLTNNAVLWNATGTNNGTAFVQSAGAVIAGGYVDFVLEFYVPSRVQPNPTLTAAVVEPLPPFPAIPGAIGQHINRGLMLPNQTFLLEFSSVSNRVYYIQYTGDLKTWQTAQPAITGNGTKIQWIDNGQPKTQSSPASQPMRLYRLILLP